MRTLLVLSVLLLLVAPLEAQGKKGRRRGRDAGPPEIERPTRTFPAKARLRSVAFHPDGKTLALGSDANTAWLLDVASGAETPLEGHADFVSRVVFSPDGALLATGGKDQRVRIWDIAAKKTIAQIPVGVGFSSESVAFGKGIGFTPDSKWLVTTSEGGRIWNARTGKPKLAFGGEMLSHPSGLFDLRQPSATTCPVFSPDGKHLLTINGTWAASTYEVVWRNPTNGQITRPLFPIGEVSSFIEGKGAYDASICFSPDGSLLGVTSPLRLYDMKKKVLIAEFDEEFERGKVIGFTPDNRRVFVSDEDGGIAILDVATRKIVARINSGEGDSAALSADGKRLAVGAFEEVRVWDLE